MLVCILGRGTTDGRNCEYGGMAINSIWIFDDTGGCTFRDQVYYSVKNMSGFAVFLGSS